MRIRLLLLVGFLIITLQACIYRMDIPQGNQIDPKKLEQLKTGMTKSQVEFLLGAPQSMIIIMPIRHIMCITVITEKIKPQN